MTSRDRDRDRAKSSRKTGRSASESARATVAEKDRASASDTLPKVDAIEGRPRIRRLRPAERLLIGERTAEVLNQAKAGSEEYAQAVNERLAAGLTVPKPALTSIDLEAATEFRTDIVDASRATRAQGWMTHGKYLLVLLVVLGAVAGMMAFYVFSTGATPHRAAPSETVSGKSAPSTLPGSEHRAISSPSGVIPPNQPEKAP